MTNLGKAAALISALLIGHAVECPAAQSESSATIVEFESPLANPQPLQGYLRQPDNAGPSPAVVLLHSCNGDWHRLDQRWGRRIASWGYVALTVDSFGPRGIKDTCRSDTPSVLAFDAYRALSFLVRQPFVDPARIVALGFSQGGWLALSSVERGAVEQSSQNKFRAAIAFYPRCRGLTGNMTVPTLMLAGELDDWAPAIECRDMVEGRDDLGISRKPGAGVPMRLVVYRGAYHAFDAPELQTPVQLFGHRLEFNQAAADRSTDLVHEFLDAMIGGKEQTR